MKYLKTFNESFNFFNDISLYKKLKSEINNEEFDITTNKRTIHWSRGNRPIEETLFFLETPSFKIYLRKTRGTTNIEDICNYFIIDYFLNKSTEIEFKDKDYNVKKIKFNKKLNDLIKEKIKSYFLPKYEKEQATKKFKI